MLSERLQTTLHKGNVPFNVNSLCSLGPMQFCSSGSKQHFTGKNSGNSWNVVWLTSGHALYICIYQVLHKKKKKKKNFWRYHHFMCTKTHNHMKYSSWDTELDKFFCHFGILGHFLPFYPTPSSPLNNPENHSFEKMKKASWYAIILNLCNKKYNHMMYAYSDMECNRHNFLSF